MTRKAYTPDTDFEREEFRDLIDSIRSLEYHELSPDFGRGLQARIDALRPSPLRKLWLDLRAYLAVVNASPVRIAFAYGIPLVLLAVIGFQVIRSQQQPSQAGLQGSRPPAGPAATQQPARPAMQPPATPAPVRGYDEQFAEAMESIRANTRPDSRTIAKSFGGRSPGGRVADLQRSLDAMRTSLEQDDFESARSAFALAIRSAESGAATAYAMMAAAYLERGDRRTAALLYWKASMLGDRQSGMEFETLKSELDAPAGGAE